MSRMQRPRAIPAELELLDSPLLSPASALPSGIPFSASLGPMPGSALAERIFNDPDSWGTDDADLDEDAGPLADPMAWFIEELERFRLGSAGVESDGSSTAFSFSPDSAGFGLDDGDAKEVEEDSEDALDKVAFIPSPGVQEETQHGVKGIKKQRKSVRPISLAALFESAGEALPKDAQVHLEEVLKSGKLPPAAYNHLKALSSGTLTTPSTGDSSALSTSGTTTSMLSDGSSLPSPVTVHSASATLSFLEWYGIYPDSPRLDASKSNSNLRKSIYTRRTPGARPHLAIPSPKSAAALIQSRPASILSPSVLMPDMSVEVPKRGSGVPPLQDLKPMLEQIIVQARKSPPAVSEKKVAKVEKAEKEREENLEKENQPLNPPGLVRPVNPPGLDSRKPSTPPPPAPPENPHPAITAPVPSDSGSSGSTTPFSTPPRRLPPTTPQQTTPKASTTTGTATPETESQSPKPNPTSSRTPTPPRARERPQALAELSRRRQLLAISVKDSPPPYTRSQSHGATPSSTATTGLGGSRPMPTTTRSSNSSEGLHRQYNNHPAPPATSNPIVPRRLPMVPPSAGAMGGGSQRAETPPATAVPHAMRSAAAVGSSSSSSRPSPSFAAPLRSAAAHSRANSNSNSSAKAGLASSTASQYAHSPLPSSSLPTAMGSMLSPEVNGGQTSVYQSRPMSAARSPMGGVMGPRSRTSTQQNNGVRTSSGLVGKPPVLNL